MDLLGTQRGQHEPGTVRSFMLTGHDDEIGGHNSWAHCT